jgi:signal transduction histidine kinase
MKERSTASSSELLAAFEEYERDRTIRNNRIGCILGIVFMPAGMGVDAFVYEDQMWHFLNLRLLCSALLAVVWWTHGTKFGRLHYRTLGLVEVSLPLGFISEMIRLTEGFASPYYAGLNLVVFGAGLLLRWRVQDVFRMLVIMLSMYLIAGFAHRPGSELEPREFRMIYNNLYFLTVTCVFIGTGLYVDARKNLREFTLRYQLDLSNAELEQNQQLLKNTNLSLEENRAQLEESNRKLIEMDQVKSRFFANISHELRTPLTLLLAPLESMIRKPDEPYSDTVREWLRTMQANGMRLLKLINDLLDLVKLESGHMQLKAEPVGMGELVKGIGDSVRKVAQDKKISLEIRVAPEVGKALVDRDKLEKVLLNLVFNAIKFSPSGGLIEIAVARDLEEIDDLSIRVSDTGMGISSENIENLFQPFWQADTSSRRKCQGTGIGLAIVKELTEAQGGTVKVESELGKGTTMIVRIPAPRVEGAGAETVDLAEPADDPVMETVADDESSDPEWLASLYRRAEFFPSLTSLKATVRPAEATSESRLPKIVVADDEPDMLRFLKSQLKEHFQVIEAVDGNQAIEQAAQYLPDIILLDMMMPEKDGLQVCRELRERFTTQSIPIVMLTARADEETKLAALEAGANDFLTKPFSPTELHVRLKNLVDSYAFQRELANKTKNLEAAMEELQDAMEMLKDTESQLVQSEKLASLGRMSAGIIHEINNPLNYAKTGLYTLKRTAAKLPEEEREDYEEVLGDIQEGVDRVIQIVSDLRTFTHPGVDQLRSVDVADLVSVSLRFLSSEWKDGKIAIEQDIPDGQEVFCNSNKLTQVIVNLLQNSLDACSEKEYADGEKPKIEIRGELENGLSILRFRDNGPGISEEARVKMFDPFFTTKDVGKGMGLGLSICYRIVEEIDGRIEVKSEPGYFCEISLEFPAKM